MELLEILLQDILSYLHNRENRAVICSSTFHFLISINFLQWTTLLTSKTTPHHEVASSVLDRLFNIYSLNGLLLPYRTILGASSHQQFNLVLLVNFRRTETFLFHNAGLGIALLPGKLPLLKNIPILKLLIINRASPSLI